VSVIDCECNELICPVEARWIEGRGMYYYFSGLSYPKYVALFYNTLRPRWSTRIGVEAGYLLTDMEKWNPSIHPSIHPSWFISGSKAHKNTKNKHKNTGTEETEQ